MPLPQKNDCSSGSVVVVGGAQLISNIDRVTANLWHVFMTIWNNNRKKNYKLTVKGKYHYAHLNEGYGIQQKSLSEVVGCIPNTAVLGLET